jgi:hypothetical protein
MVPPVPRPELLVLFPEVTSPAVPVVEADVDELLDATDAGGCVDVMISVLTAPPIDVGVCVMVIKTGERDVVADWEVGVADGVDDVVGAEVDDEDEKMDELVCEKDDEELLLTVRLDELAESEDETGVGVLLAMGLDGLEGAEELAGAADVVGVADAGREVGVLVELEPDMANGRPKTSLWGSLSAAAAMSAKRRGAASWE